MGRIRTTLIKRTGERLLKTHPEAFNTDFDYNKKEVEKFAEIYSKKLRNVIAGYITKLVKNNSKRTLI